MRREPMRIAVVGAGRAGSSLARLLARSGARVTLLGRPSPAARRRWRSAILDAGVVLICVPDEAVARVGRDLARLPLEGRIVLHTSGVSPADSLSALRAAGARIGSLHPLASFPPRGAPPPDLTGVAFAVDGDPAARSAAASLARRLGGRPIPVPASRRASWHLAASLISNGLTAVVAAGLRIAEDGAGLSAGGARRAFLPLARLSLDHLERAEPRRALTGPVARGDLGTVRRHLDALRGRPPALRRLYAALALMMADLARSDGRLGARKVSALRRLLGPSGRARRR